MPVSGEDVVKRLGKISQGSAVLQVSPDIHPGCV